MPHLTTRPRYRARMWCGGCRVWYVAVPCGPCRCVVLVGSAGGDHASDAAGAARPSVHLMVDGMAAVLPELRTGGFLATLRRRSG